MSSLLIPLLIFCVLLYLNRQRARRRELPSAESWRAEALEAAIALVEAGTAATVADPAPAGEPAQMRIATVPIAARAPVGQVQALRYLLDGDDPRPHAVDRVARLQRAMRGPGLCSPRQSS